MNSSISRWIEKLEGGAEESLKRLFPRFKEADFAASAWEAAPQESPRRR